MSSTKMTTIPLREHNRDASENEQTTVATKTSLPIVSSQSLPQHSCLPDATKLLEGRRQNLGPNLALFFPNAPLHIVRGQGCYLYDEQGNEYLDCINNVSHVGHCHPRVVAACSRQLAMLNTNSRYLHQGLVQVSQRLTDTMPAPLKIMYPLCSGSEANDLAWRIATAAVLAQNPLISLDALHVAVVDHGYHGHTSLCIDLSAYKFFGPGGRGPLYTVQVLPCPDPYRGHNLDGRVAARAAIAAAQASGGRIAAFYCESIISCGGQVVLPSGWLKSVYEEMRAAGAICIADEVQCGFARVGNSFWGFQLPGYDVVPDIVTIGKPMGNGFPCAAVITTPKLATVFAESGMEFFATFGGCTAATAAALAVLDVIRDERLQHAALEVGNYAMDKLRELQMSYDGVIGDVRGIGLMLGVEMVMDAKTRVPAPATAAFVKDFCRMHHRVLLSTEGPYSNVIKIKPPLCFSKGDVDRMIFAIEQALKMMKEMMDEGVLESKNLEAISAVNARRQALGASILR